MAHPHKSYDPHGPIGRLRELCLALEEATEKEAWGESTFRIGGKMFAMTDNNHHGDGRIAVWCNAPLGFQSMMVGMAPERYFAPPYVGHKGWIGVRLDGDVDWDELATIVEQAYRMSGPRLPPARKSLSGKISVAPAKKPARHRSRARFPIGRAPKGKRTR